MSVFRRTTRVSLLASLLLAGGVCAQGDLDARADRLSSLVRERSMTSDNARRASLTSEIRSLRRGLINDAPEDVRAPTWMIDQAAALIDRVDRTGALPAMRFGTPTTAERRSVELAARDASRTLETARLRLEDAIERLETELLGDPGSATAEVDDARSAEIEHALARLIDREQLSRLPYYEGLAASMLVLTDPDEASQRRHAKRVAESLAGLDLPAGEALARGRVAIGSTISAIGSDDAAALDSAREWFERARDGSAPRGSIGHTDAVLGLASVLSRRAGVAPDAVWAAAHTVISPTPDDPRLVLRISDGVATSIARVASDDAGWLGEAIRPMLAIPGQASDAERVAWETLVHQKVAILSSPAWPFDRLPAEVAFARAVARDGRGTIAGPNESTRLLESVADRPDAGRFAPKAMWALAARRADSEDPTVLIETVALLDRLVRTAPASPEASNAASAAPVVGRYAYEQSVGTAHLADAERAYLMALRLGAFTDPPTDDAPRWRASLAVLLTERPALVPDVVDRLDEILRAVEAVPIEASQTTTLHGTLKRAIAPHAEMLDPATTTRAYDWARTRSDPDEPYFRFVTAGALLEAQPALSLQLLEPIVTARSPARGVDVERARALLGIAQRRTGARDDAFATLRDLTSALESAGTTGPTYWMAWAELLEMLAEDNADGSRSPTIRLQIRRLRVLDPALGGAAFASRIESVEAGLQ